VPFRLSHAEHLHDLIAQVIDHLTAMRPFVGLSNGRALWSVAQASGSISALSRLQR
jgi:hypothetical protein